MLAGGTGGAKFARGMLDVVGSDLVVIANTGDDVEVHGAYVSPDPDLICFWLADRIDDRGWGLQGDTFDYMSTVDHWFSLGDEDRAIGIRRRELIEGGGTLTQAISGLATDLGIDARVLPMSDEPVRTEILSGGRWVGFQEFMVRERAAIPIDDVRFRGAAAAAPTAEVRAAIEGARAVIIGPSNPVASIGPILAICEQDLRGTSAPVVAVSPIVGGAVLKGPTAAFMAHAGHAATTAGVAALYGDLLDGLVADEAHCGSLPELVTSTLMTSDRRAALATETLAFADSLR